MGLSVVRSLVGFGGLALVAAGAWGLFGWPAAALVVGIPIAAFYLFSEARSVWRAGGD